MFGFCPCNNIVGFRGHAVLARLHLAVFVLSSPSVAYAQDKLDFARDIRPILANHCWGCHGFDESSRGAGLRLDLRDSATALLKSGRRAIVPGKSDDSALVQRLFHDKPARRMPPPDFKKQLSEGQRMLLKRWIDEGAPFAEHWAFVSPRRPDLPTVKNTAWPINPIDRFILQRLEGANLAPSPPAAKETLLRRAALDLTGLPPTLAELDLFLQDTSPDAYEKAVDRLLASPHYGERMALAWLDAARYADTNGYNNDEERTQWPWRDWVIRAFATNMPYDRFLVEQIAGDLLPSPTLDQKIATGFNRNHVLTTEGGIIAEEYRVEYVADRVHTTATAVLALSLQCARCHDHKYDPISQKEYYQFFGFFNNIEDGVVKYNAKGAVNPFVKYAPPEAQTKLTALEVRLRDLDARIQQREQAADSRAWEAKLTPEERKKIAAGTLGLHLALDEGQGTKVGDKGAIKGNARWTDGKIGKALDFDGASHVDLGNLAAVAADAPFSFSVWVYPRVGEGAILSKMNDKAAYRGYDLLIEGGGKIACHLIQNWPEDGLKVMTKNPLTFEQWHHVGLTYDGTRKAAGVKIYVDGKLAELTISADKLKGALDTPMSFRLGRRGESLPFKGKIDDLRFFRLQLAPEEVADLAAGKSLPQVADLLGVAAGKRTPEQNHLIRKYYLDNVDPEYRKLTGERAELVKRQTELDQMFVPTMVMQERPTRRETFLLKRGQYDQPGDKVEPGVPTFLPTLPKETPNNRLGLARWLVEPSHPLTARVAVNRWWASYFGGGLVETVEDFGLQGDLPSHPELLDWLATELVRTRWDVKAMQKLIVTSATYRQSSRVTPEHLAKDPKNKLLARSPRYRLPAETVRDNALAISGLLKNKIGGPSVKPYQPAGLWEDVTVERRYKYVPDKGEGLYRRSMYTFWRRTVPPPGMTTFDAPDRETCVPRRARTNTPLQALILLNDPTYVEAARVFAARLMKVPADERVTLAFKLALARPASADEQRIMLGLYADSLQRFQADPAAATKLLAVGDSPRDMKVDPPEHAAWTSVASILLNLDETISRP